jgi:3-oxoacyl-[acyl-carrier protein] reductase
MTKNKLTALVTGGSRGIGKAISLEMARKGCFVYIIYASNKDAAHQTISEIEAEGGMAYALQASVNDINSIKAVVKKIIEQQGKIDFCINNAGITRDKLFFMMQEDDWREVIDTNLVGTILVTKEVIKHMMKAGYGRIVNLSSVGGIIGTPGQTNYAASKAGIIGFTKSLAKEVASYNITVNSIAAGYIETEMTSKLGEVRLGKIIQSIPLKRMASTQEIASCVSYFTSDAGGYITGQTLNIDGGLTCI